MKINKVVDCLYEDGYSLIELKLNIEGVDCLIEVFINPETEHVELHNSAKLKFQKNVLSIIKQNLHTINVPKS